MERLVSLMGMSAPTLARLCDFYEGSFPLTRVFGNADGTCPHIFIQFRLTFCDVNRRFLEPALACAHPIDFDQQMLWAAQEGTGTVGWGVHNQARLLQPPHEFRQRDLGLHACQRCAKADMDATAKPQVLIIAPLRIKAI